MAAGLGRTGESSQDPHATIARNLDVGRCLWLLVVRRSGAGIICCGSDQHRRRWNVGTIPERRTRCVLRINQTLSLLRVPMTRSETVTKLYARTQLIVGPTSDCRQTGSKVKRRGFILAGSRGEETPMVRILDDIRIFRTARVRSALKSAKTEGVPYRCIGPAGLASCTGTMELRVFVSS